MAFDSLKQPEISTSRLSRLSFHFQEPERSTVETGRLVFAAAGSVQREDDDRCGDIRCARGSLTPSSSCKEIRGNSSARDGHDMDIAGFCHMIFVENLEKGILPLTITDFIFQQLRISCQAFVLPSNPSEAYTRGITMVNNKRNLDLLSDFLESSDHVVTPSSGRPWVVTGRLRVSFKTCKLTTQTTFMTEPKQQYGLCISNVERRIVCGTTIVAFILENFIFIGTDTRATDYSGSVTRTNVNKLRLLTEHIVGAMAGDGAACLGLWVHLRGLIRDYNENETRNRLGSKRSSDRLGVKVVARRALDYLKRKNEHDTEL
uniref:uncharacterized protein LOC105349949 n=1 Tax=Fragaria vesca subsp. vesca TaxID=101020 RepID=UPI0005C8DBC8|nr:PREDICTED: uncharacterized protein LOC105349949 [Fragaria vesca subsp. vesca]